MDRTGAESFHCPLAVCTLPLKQPSQHDAGTMVFASGRLLTPVEIGDVMLNRVRTEKEPEVAIPFRWATMARIANLFPNFGAVLLPSLFKKGRVYQSRHAKSTDGGAAEES